MDEAGQPNISILPIARFVLNTASLTTMQGHASLGYQQQANPEVTAASRGDQVHRSKRGYPADRNQPGRPETSGSGIQGQQGNHRYMPWPRTGSL